MKLIIVDDEYLFREALKVSIDFEGLDLDIAGEAKNGKEALKLLIENEPDIALIDINMPIMDGLEFAKYVHDNKIDTKIIIISGYDQFDYAKQAIHLGVHSYLLKPVDEVELESELKELIRSIQVERSVNEELDVLKKQARTNIPFLRERLILDILMGYHDQFDENLWTKIDYLDITLPYNQFSIIALDLIEDDNKVALDEEMREVYRLSLKKLVISLLGDSVNYECTYDYKQRLCIIFENNDHYSQERLTAQLGSIIKVLRDKNGLQPMIGISNSYDKGEYMNTAYKEAIAAINYGVYQDQSISYYGTFVDKGLNLVIITKEERNELLIHMRMGNKKEVLGILRGIFNKIRKNHLHLNHLRYAFMELSSLCMELLSEFDYTEDIFNRLIKELYEESHYNQPIEQLEMWLSDSIKEVMDLIQVNKTSKSLELVQEIKNYVDNYYNLSDFTIDDISKSLYVNYSHLCYTFKKETNTTINDYLIEKRLNSAIALINKGHVVVKSISEAVGFADSGYFSKSFKKHIGVTPTQYINSKK